MSIASQFMSQEPEELMPEAPEVSGTFDASLLEDVKKRAAVIPPNIYHVKLVEYEMKFPERKEEEETDTRKRPTKQYHFDDGTPVGIQPYFNCTFAVQTEPHIGHRLWKMVPWVSDEVFERALAGDKGAQEVVRNRLSDAKELMLAAGYKASGQFNFVTDFLDTAPELRVKVRKTKKRAQDAKGKWVLTDEERNEISELLKPMKGR